jgi:DNA polymerase III delta prime subunit
MKIEQTLWIEKYRPKKIDDVVLSKEYEREIKKDIQTQDIPHYLFHGPQGGGKSTVARIITSKYGVLQNPGSNLLEVNGSAKKSRNISFVDDVIEPFLRSPPAGKDKWKIVFVDEGDNLGLDAFRSLRGLIEKYQVKYGRFILTGNYPSRIPDPVRSRFREYSFKQLSLEFVTTYCRTILETENIKYADKDLKFVVENLYPDIRKIVDTLQRMSLDGKLHVNTDIALTTEKAIIGTLIEVFGYIKDKQNHKINKSMGILINLLDKYDLEFRHVYSSLFGSKQVPVPAKVVINKYANSHQACLVPSMHFSAMIMETIQAVSQYYSGLGK